MDPKEPLIGGASAASLGQVTLGVSSARSPLLSPRHSPTIVIPGTTADVAVGSSLDGGILTGNLSYRGSTGGGHLGGDTTATTASSMASLGGIGGADLGGVKLLVPLPHQHYFPGHQQVHQLGGMQDTQQQGAGQRQQQEQQQGVPAGEGQPPSPDSIHRPVARAYDEPKRTRAALKARILNVLLVSGDCFFLGMQPILVYMCKVDGKFLFDPISVNFLTEICKMAFATVIIIIQARSKKKGEAAAYSLKNIWKAAKANTLLAVPAGLYSVNNYLKFVMQLYFKPTTVKMLSNLKILVIALLLKIVMKRRFSTIQWEALILLLIGISVNQVPCGATSSDSLFSSVAGLAWVYTFFSVTIPSTASVFNEYALKSQFDTSVHLQNFFMYCYGVAFNLFFFLFIHALQGGQGLSLFEGHSRATALLIANNALQGILSSFFFKYADAILKKYSSTIATIFTALASASLFGHSLTINFILGVTVVLISMHQFFSAAVPQAKPSRGYTTPVSYSYSYKGHDAETRRLIQRDSSLLEIAAGAHEEANHHTPKVGATTILLPK